MCPGLYYDAGLGSIVMSWGGSRDEKGNPGLKHSLGSNNIVHIGGVCWYTFA